MLHVDRNEPGPDSDSRHREEEDERGDVQLGVPRLMVVRLAKEPA